MRRPNLGFTEIITIKIHPDLKEWLDKEAARHYCTVPEIVRRLIVEARGFSDHA